MTITDVGPVSKTGGKAGACGASRNKGTPSQMKVEYKLAP